MPYPCSASVNANYGVSNQSPHADEAPLTREFADATNSPPPRPVPTVVDSPYLSGRIMNLITQEGIELQATIVEMWPITMQPVMKVRFVAHDGAGKTAVLKLYDRRFGFNRDGKAYTQDRENNFQEYICSGEAGTFITQLQAREDAEKAINASDSLGSKLDEEDDEENLPEWERFARSEARTYFRTRLAYNNEVDAYSLLKPLQGRCVPRWIASVKADSLPNPGNLPTRYFEMLGILIEYVPGFVLRDLVDALPNESQLWDDIVHNAVETTKLVNDGGVLHGECQPRNFIVQPIGPRKYQTYLIDFAKCYFRSEYKDTDDPEDEDGFIWQIASSGNNAEEISVIMAGKILRLTGVKINFPFHFLQ